MQWQLQCFYNTTIQYLCSRLGMKIGKCGENYKLLLSVESGLHEEGSRYNSFCRDHKFKQLYVFTFPQLKPSNIFGCIWYFSTFCVKISLGQICQQVIEFRWNFETFEMCAANSAKMKYFETRKYESLTMVLHVRRMNHGTLLQFYNRIHRRTQILIPCHICKKM